MLLRLKTFRDKNWTFSLRFSVAGSSQFTQHHIPLMGILQNLFTLDQLGGTKNLVQAERCSVEANELHQRNARGTAQSVSAPKKICKAKGTRYVSPNVPSYLLLVKVQLLKMHQGLIQVDSESIPSRSFAPLINCSLYPPSEITLQRAGASRVLSDSLGAAGTLSPLWGVVFLSLLTQNTQQEIWFSKAEVYGYFLPTANTALLLPLRVLQLFPCLF